MAFQLGSYTEADMPGQWPRNVDEKQATYYHALTDAGQRHEQENVAVCNRAYGKGLTNTSPRYFDVWSFAKPTQNLNVREPAR